MPKVEKKNSQEVRTMRFLERWRPLTDLERFRSEFDDLLTRFGFEHDWLGRWPFDRRFFGEGEPIAARPAIESSVEEGKFIVRADLPGIDPKNVEIKMVGNVLTIKGSREEKRESKKADYLRREIRYGAFERSIPLPEGLKAEDLKATYHDGVLEVSAPMPKETAPKEVKIQVESPQPPAGKNAQAA
jgi:HSP20 family protein